MPKIEHLELMIHGVQALRRHVEQLSCPIAGASGIRAQFYPHQVQNVKRILSATRIHHLIADEVGMGKTIQALMVANAIRLQTGKLRVRVVVPRKELQNQWIEEIATRAQCTAEFGFKAEDDWTTNEDDAGSARTIGDDWFDVVDDSTMVKPSETLAPDSLDLLILDEPQSLKLDTRRFVAANSANFPSLLLLTATPNLRDLPRFLELLQILEPDRIERARREADGDSGREDLDWSRSRIGDLDDAVLQLVHKEFDLQSVHVDGGVLDASLVPGGVSDGYSSIADFRRVRVLADTRWQYRRVLRSYRTDFPDHLPRRHPKHLVVEPTTAEADRLHASQSYLGHFLEDHSEPKHKQVASSLMQRTVLGGQSLQNRLVQLRRGDDEHEPRLQKMSELSRREFSDSRLDCLVDWLIRFWHQDPTRKVVIAAEDNATIEELDNELAWRVPTVGPRGKRIKLNTVLATDGKQVDGEESELDSQTLRNIANAKLRAFEKPGNQLLLAHHSFRESFNLQIADALIFYSLPWKPEDVDQWIGRVDRLGREFVDPDRPSSRPKPVRILTIHRNGDPSIGVQSILDEYRIFETAIDPERGILQEISNNINARALPADRSGRTIGDMASDNAATSRAEASKETAAPSGCPWTIDNAVSLHHQVARRSNIGPSLRQNRTLGYVTSPSEKAMACWLGLLRNQKWINVVTFKGKKQPNGTKSCTFYTLGQNKSVDVKLTSVQDKSHPFPPFFVARGNIQRPPRLKVETSPTPDGTPRIEPLQFLSFGSTIHEDLVSTFRRAGRNSEPLGMTVYSLGERHYPKGTDLTCGNYLLGVGFVDSAVCFKEINIKALLLGESPETAGTRRDFMRGRVLANVKAGLESDERFVRLQRPPFLACMAWRLKAGNQMESCTDQIASDLLGADWRKKERPNVESKQLPPDYIKQLPLFCISQILQRTKTQWAEGLTEVAEAFAERQEVIRVEAEDRLWVIRAAINEIEAEIESRESNPTESNRQAIAANFAPRLAQFREEVLLIERSRELRLQVLSQTFEHLRAPNQEHVQLQCTAVLELQNDPVPMPEKTDELEGGEQPVAEGDESPTVDNSREKLPNRPR